MSRINELRLIARVAQMYYAENLKQADISKHLHISQATISRLLRRAHEEHIVRITITAPNGTYPDVEKALRDRYGIAEIIVADCGEDREDSIGTSIAAAAALFVETTLEDKEVIGISSWSSTILKMVDSIHPIKRAKSERVVQILGGMGNTGVQISATHMVTHMAKKTGGQPQFLAAPGVANSLAAKLVFLGDPFVCAACDQFRRLTLAFVGIGSVEPSVMLANSGNRFTVEELHELTDQGAVGDIGLRFFDAQGNLVKTPLDDRVIGISLEQLKEVPRVIGVAGGARKVAAIRGALRGGHIDVLITDKFTAAKLLSDAGP
ncbi:MAG: sugar-binding transcriptional regulator [Azospirillaceae bacterium]|nr:sugar-binding transcriptional regulator [Azospirillaceae bacterium]